MNLFMGTEWHLDTPRNFRWSGFYSVWTSVSTRKYNIIIRKFNVFGCFFWIKFNFCFWELYLPGSAILLTQTAATKVHSTSLLRNQGWKTMFWQFSMPSLNHKNASRSIYQFHLTSMSLIPMSDIAVRAPNFTVRDKILQIKKIIRQ